MQALVEKNRTIIKLLIFFAAAVMLPLVLAVTADAVSVTKCTVSGITSAAYTGSAIHQKGIKVTYNGKKLTINKDYTVSYKNNVNAGTASVIIKGKGSYSGTVTKKFTIAKKSLSFATVSKIADKNYTGKALKPLPAVKLSGKTLKKNTDYTITYSANTKVGTAKVIIKGKGNYSGSKTVTFKIKALPLSKAAVTVPDIYFTGKAVKPAVTVKYGSTVYKSGTDYTVTYKNNINTGTGTVTIKGKGGLSGSKTLKFKIKARPVSTIKLSVSSPTYTGKALKPTVKATYGSMTYTLNKHYTLTYKNNTNAGTASVTVKGKGGLTGSKTITFKIKAASLSSASVAVPPATFTGKALKPAVSVTLGKLTLKSGTDYTVTYADNTNAGGATVTVKGKGNYTGTLKKTFMIYPRPLSQVKLTGSADFSPLGVQAEVVGTYSSYTLKSSDITYTVPNEVGTHSVTVSGKGNFSGSKDISVKVLPADISKALAKITVDEDNAFDVTVTLGEYVLDPQTDYTAQIEENDGTVTAHIIGTGSYTGETEQSTPLAALLYSFDITDIADQTYTAKAIKPSFAVILSGGKLIPNEDYTYEYKNNTEVGTAELIVTGKGDYEGIVGTKEFKIIPAEIKKSKAAFESEYIYDGKAVKPIPTLTFNGKTLKQNKDFKISSYSSNTAPGTGKMVIKGITDFTGSVTLSFKIIKKPADSSEEAKVKQRLDDMMAGKYNRKINSYMHSYKLGDYFNTYLTSPCTCHSFCNNGYEDGCSCLIGRSNLLRDAYGNPFSGIQCAGFTFEVFEYLFGSTNGAGENTLTRYGSDCGNWNLSAIKKSFSENFRPGDYLAYTNVKYGYDHYVIVYDTDDTGIWVYEANYGGRCKINFRKMTYEEIYEQLDYIYHRTPNNYKLG